MSPAIVNLDVIIVFSYGPGDCIGRILESIAMMSTTIIVPSSSMIWTSSYPVVVADGRRRLRGTDGTRAYDADDAACSNVEASSILWLGILKMVTK